MGNLFIGLYYLLDIRLRVPVHAKSTARRLRSASEQ
jgi:hypothetical protein